MKALQNCRVLDLGLVDYEIVHDLQKKIVEDVIGGRAPQTLVTCEHPHVITLSRRANKRHILASDAQLKKMGVGICITDRGGEVTYHGPGQLVLYPIFDLRKDKKDLHLFLRRLEEVVIRALRSNFGLNALRKKGMTGVWVGPYKVASIGIGVRHWVSYHGLSLNVKADNRFFNLIKPCGLDVKMASLNDFFSDGVSLDAVKVMLLESIEDVFGFKLKGGMGK
jgi:lipoate-protein ligase B